MPAVNPLVASAPASDVPLGCGRWNAQSFVLYASICTGLFVFVFLVAGRIFASTFPSRRRAAESQAIDIFRRPTTAGSYQSGGKPFQRLRPTQNTAWKMDEKSRGVSPGESWGDPSEAGSRGPLHVSFARVDRELAPGHSALDRDLPGSDVAKDGATTGASKALDLASHRFILSRPPPPPPLTPPELSSAVFPFQGRRRSQPGSIAELDTAFFDQPNPDYMSATAGSSTTTSMSRVTAGSSSPSTPRRRSYTKTIPINIPASSSSSSSAMLSGADLVSSPASYPPTSFQLPPPPPVSEEWTSEPLSLQEIEMQGEIISVLDDAGAGWKRHTRVYGGGVCLACAASGQDGHGGFYGDTVRPEDRH